MNFIRTFFFILGSIFLSIGVAGIVIPILPTTPLVLISVFCFAKSSKKAARWISSNRYFGSYINNYQNNSGVPLDVKIKSIAFLWVMLVISCYFFSDILYLLFVTVVGCAVTAHILLLKTQNIT